MRHARQRRLVACCLALALTACTGGGRPPWAERGGAGLAGAGRYIPLPGDSVSVIAARLGVPAASIIAANDLKPPYTIYVGRALVIPGPANGEPRSAPRPTAVASRPAPAATAPAAPATPVTASPLPPPRDAPPATAATPAEIRTVEAQAVEASRRASLPPAARSADGFIWPVDGEVIARFGDVVDGRPNDGVNIAAPLGAPVRAADNGVVVYADNELPGYGNLVLIRHADGFITAYAHNASLLVALGDPVERGQVIARVGQSGAVSRPQVHFRLRRGEERLDPAAWLPPRATRAAATGASGPPG